MKAFIIRVNGRWVQFVDQETSRVIFTDDVEEAGFFTEKGAVKVLSMLKGIEMKAETVH